MLKEKFEVPFAYDLIIDLRHVREARLHQTVMLADALRSQGEIVTVTTRLGAKTYHADEDCLFRESLIYVLGDGSVSSVTEWLAASLRHDKRVKLMGPPTAGHPYATSEVDVGSNQVVSMEISILSVSRMTSSGFGVMVDFIDGGVGIDPILERAFLAQ